jgi:hypothetical protein
MKTFILAAVLSVGVLLRPEMAPVTSDSQPGNQTPPIGAISQAQPTASSLGAMEMSRLQGGGIVECHQSQDVGGDVYVSCCINLWLVRLCAEVNWSAVERIWPF